MFEICKLSKSPSNTDKPHRQIPSMRLDQPHSRPRHVAGELTQAEALIESPEVQHVVTVFFLISIDIVYKRVGTRSVSSSSSILHMWMLEVHKLIKILTTCGTSSFSIDNLRLSILLQISLIYHGGLIYHRAYSFVSYWIRNSNSEGPCHEILRLQNFREGIMIQSRHSRSCELRLT